MYIGKLLSLTFLAATSVFADIAVTFTYDFTGYAQCSQSVTTSCLENFELSLVSGGGTPVVVPIPAGATGRVTGITGVVPFTGIGSVVVQAVAVAKDSTGARLVSPPAKITVAVEPKVPQDIVARNQ